MLPTWTGLIVIAIGIWCQFGDFRRTLVAMIVVILFEAADAADLIALGGASITPAKLFLGFVVLRILSMRGGGAAMLAELTPRRVMFLYLILVIWVVASAVLLPRLFEGATQVFTLARSDIDTGAVPLSPSSGNITQAIYATGGFVTALGTCVLARRRGGYAAILTGILWVTGLDIFFALFDLFTAATHTEFLLDLFHTGNYTFLTSDESGGLKRISGTYSEASAFATISLDLLAINVSLFLSRVRQRLTASYSIVLAVLLFLSTSSTAYVGLAALSAALVAWSIYAVIFRGNARPLKVVVIGSLLGAFLVCCMLLFLPSLATAVWTLLDISLFQKGTTDSAVERASFNTQAIKIFFDTWGLGAGIGSTRTSNFILVVASNLGVPGLVLFAALILALAFVRTRQDLDGDARKLVMAARVGVLASLVPATLIATVFDLGPLFYILVGVVASSARRGEAGTQSKTSVSWDAPQIRARQSASAYARPERQGLSDLSYSVDSH